MCIMYTNECFLTSLKQFLNFNPLKSVNIAVKLLLALSIVFSSIYLRTDSM